MISTEAILSTAQRQSIPLHGCKSKLAVTSKLVCQACECTCASVDSLEEEIPGPEQLRGREAEHAGAALRGGEQEAAAGGERGGGVGERTTSLLYRRKNNPFICFELI
mmetsp:Transcript_31139/g.89343  ORF Transcript_31139/g.89343 Transcript_31139/m.89343 type:complete len:108 (-) Transcript_31139:466-789(-)